MKIGIVGQNSFLGKSGGESAKYCGNRNPESANTRNSIHLVRIHSNVRKAIPMITASIAAGWGMRFKAPMFTPDEFGQADSVWLD